MKSRDTLVRLKRFQVEEKRRRVAQIEMMMADFNRMAADLEREIVTEEQKTGISDPQHFAYSTYARAASQRRDNLRRSAEDLTTQLDEAKADLGEAFEELRKAESLEDRERASEKTSDALRDGVISGQAGARAMRVPI
jgi:flagellar export protein FliJ